MKSKDLKIGDIVVLKKGDRIPADMLTFRQLTRDVVFKNWSTGWRDGLEIEKVNKENSVHDKSIIRRVKFIKWKKLYQVIGRIIASRNKVHFVIK